MSTTSPAPESPYALYCDYMAQIERATGRPFGLHPSEEEFRILWERIPPQEQTKLLAAYRAGFSRAVEESWPRTEAAIKAIRSGHLDPEIVTRIPRRRTTP